MASKKNSEQVAKFADMFSAMGTEARLRIMQLLLSAHPEGMVVGELQEELDIPNSTLSHHLDKLRHEGLVQVGDGMPLVFVDGHVRHRRPVRLDANGQMVLLAVDATTVERTEVTAALETDGSDQSLDFGSEKGENFSLESKQKSWNTDALV